MFVSYGGEGEIRTPEPRKEPPVFKTGAINRSATSPLQSTQLLTRILSGDRGTQDLGGADGLSTQRLALV